MQRLQRFQETDLAWSCSLVSILCAVIRPRPDGMVLGILIKNSDISTRADPICKHPQLTTADHFVIAVGPLAAAASRPLTTLPWESIDLRDRSCSPDFADLADIL